MFGTKEERLKKTEDELLEIFILLDKNTFADSKEATVRYAKLKGITNMAVAFTEAKAKYKMFMQNL